MVQPLTYFKESASQTAGPYVHIGCTPNFSGITGVYDTDLGSGPMVNDQTRGERITIRGFVYDGAMTPLKDAMIEIWQADADGYYNSPSETRGKADPNFFGWARQPGDMATGEFAFETIKPGKVPFRDGRLMAPHVTFWVVARGINLGLNTRMYFSDEEEANAADPILSRIEHRVRVPTLIGKRDGNTVTFNIYLQGENETIFFDI
ncbi:protocatechuate 3,4-dioxygenase subunit alpha [Neorhizobium galegae]|uniref:protocatechuate 3,4-dioxygenase subunit alpha n=1 Tax=Neorhizobium galegae TaxID=399 RepID=UPI000621F452|nr:protocatechuate 3,4-dioxygenase subunit alpha [Neorhizobium galegae]CDZ26726.1 Protocatechuate 3,4-dioxygenase, alpha subunit [Neorhizobium galegae bv. officinalis]KAA9383688.1 protocatechuate 3,4-dioxygenase subunit alpha [Neorhizobium galegae]KAB1111816.1 protocatechuate 3,4-dioxygenase subunit alpha [Neorhizobium galegae]MCM2500898.1 protocatechuate 3,4-dioxygenase subunit alpha [Neorhizobium galegae]MCQ1768278.1 protocatechuate 3,4-dioxygenase subunit alpha [Neorhizobium galegae]